MISKRLACLCESRLDVCVVLSWSALIFSFTGIVAAASDDGNSPSSAAPSAVPPARVRDSAKPVDKATSLKGIVRTESDSPLADVHISLYIVSSEEPRDVFAKTTTDAAGRFQFSDVPSLAEAEAEEPCYALVATEEEHASLIKRIGPAERGEIEVRMLPRGRLLGRVLDPEGMPVQGVRVWSDGLWDQPVNDVLSATTNELGQFAIVDTPSHKERLRARHPNFADKSLVFRSTLPNVELRLEHGGTLRGNVNDPVIGKPADGVVVTIQPTKQSVAGVADCHHPRTTRTNAKGEYQFDGLAEMEYNVWARADGRTCAALNSVSVVKNQIQTVKDLNLLEGSWLEGRVLTLSGQPISRDPKTGARLKVGVNGPARPRTGANFDVVSVDDDGHFRMRVPPGRTIPFLLAPELWEQTWLKERFERGIEVKAGQPTSVNFRISLNISKAAPLPRPERDRVRLPRPVEEEWDAAETIRDLGGWYTLDSERHVEEINMVYHVDAGTRYDNKYVNSDEALRLAPAFPRLKRLYLKQSQASDEAMHCLANLKGLETFFVWDATAITDEGGQYLAHLANLQSIHMSNGRIGDATLEVLSKLPNLSSLSLQGNQFSDAGLAHVSQMTQLRSLWVGMSRGTITDTGLEYLANLPNLQALDLQRSKVTETALKEFKEARPELKVYK